MLMACASSGLSRIGRERRRYCAGFVSGVEEAVRLLRMDDQTGNSTYSQNAAILHVDLAGQSGVQLYGNHWNLADESHSGDGIAVSPDGETW